MRELILVLISQRRMGPMSRWLIRLGHWSQTFLNPKRERGTLAEGCLVAVNDNIYLINESGKLLRRATM